jgi:hypothetical protein
MSDRKFYFFRVVTGPDASIADFDTREEAEAFAARQSAPVRIDEYVSRGSGWAFRYTKDDVLSNAELRDEHERDEQYLARGR